MSAETTEKEKDCICRCQEEFMDCVEYDRSDCVAGFHECSGTCER